MSRDDSKTEGPSAVGTDLRDAREALGITVADMADTLRIRAAHIEALEDGRFSELPGRPYTLGFARSIARHLGLDADMIAARLREEVTGVARPVELVFPESTEDKRLSRAGWIAISLVLVAAAYGAWLTLGPASGERSSRFAATTSAPNAPSNVIPPESGAAAPAGGMVEDKTPETTVETTVGVAPAPASEAPVESAPAAMAAPQSDQPPVAASPAPASPTAAPGVASQPSPAAPEAVQPPSSAAVSAPAANAPAVPADEEDATPQPSAVVATPASSAALPTGRVVLRARQDSWVQIQGANGTTLMARTLRAGEAYAVPEQAGLRLTTGNAGGLDIFVDGQAAPALGQIGAVRRNIALDPVRLKAGTALE